MRLYLNVPAREALPGALAHAHRLWAAQARWHGAALERCAADLLELKNGTWLGDGDTALTAEQFKARLALESITIEADGGFGFCFDDGDLFWGHAIMLDGDFETGLAEANIAG